MSFRETLFTRMTGFAGLNALVGTRVYPVKLKQQDIMPAIRYTRITSTTPSAMGSDVGITDYRYQFDVFGKNYASVDVVVKQLKLALVRWKNSGVPKDSFMLTESDVYESDVELYKTRLDIRFIVEE